MTEPVDAAARLRATDPRQSFVVRAPAGSGKTGLLTQRFLRTLACVQAPEQVLAVTFTRKAAAEMQTRILAALTEAVAVHEQRMPLPEEGFARQTVEFALEAWRNAKTLGFDPLAEPHRLKILTIDSLCAAIVGRSPLGGEPVPQYTPVEDAKALYRQAARDAMESAAGIAQYQPNLRRLLRAFENNSAMLEDVLAGMLGRRDQWQRMGQRLRARGEFVSAVSELVDEYLAEGAALFPAPLLEELDVLTKFARANREAEGDLGPLAFVPPSGPLNLRDLTQAKGLRGLLLQGEGLVRKRVDCRQGFPAQKNHDDPDLAKARKDAMESLLGRLPEYPGLVGWLRTVEGLPDPAKAADDWGLLHDAATLLEVASTALKIVFAARRQVDFIAAQTAADEVLGTLDAPTDFALSLDYRLAHILIDEFQDTSLGQFELFEKLTAGWTGEDGRTIFFVGDPMQSIYRFREANYALFLRLIDQCRFGSVPLTPLELRANFRARPELVNWLNAHRKAFEPEQDTALMPPPNTARGRRMALAWVDAVAARAPDPSGRSGTCLHLFADAGLDAEVARVVEIVEQRRREDPKATIGVLARRRALLTPVAQAFSAARIPFRGLDLESLLDRPVVRDGLSLTLALLSPTHLLAWLSVLRLPAVGLSLEDLLWVADAARANAPGRRAEAADVWSVLKRLDSQTSLVGISDDGHARLAFVYRALAPVEALRGRIPLATRVRHASLALGLADTLDSETDRQALTQFLAALDALEMDEQTLTEAQLTEHLTGCKLVPEAESGEAVQLMTIHRSKGLEFDTVIVIGLGDASKRHDVPLILWQEFALGSGDSTLAAARSRGDKKDGQLFKFLETEEKLEDRLEHHRLLYVALTRGRSHTELIGNIKFKKDGELSRAGGSFLDLMWPALGSTHIEALVRENETGATAPVEDEAAGFPAPDPRFGPALLHPERPYMRRSGSGIAEASAACERLPAPMVDPEPTPPRPEFNWAGRGARITGTVVHGLLEFLGRPGAPALEAMDDAECLTVASTILRAHGIRGAEASAACKRVAEALRRIVRDEHARWVFDPSHSEIHNEWDLTLVTQDAGGQPITRRVVIDRSFVDQGRRWIIDYKTSTHEGGRLEDFLEEERRRYAAQLERYARAVATIEDRPVSVGLYFPLLSKLLTWVPEPSTHLAV